MGALKNGNPISRPLHPYTFDGYEYLLSNGAYFMFSDLANIAIGDSYEFTFDIVNVNNTGIRRLQGIQPNQTPGYWGISATNLFEQDASTSIGFSNIPFLFNEKYTVKWNWKLDPGGTYGMASSYMEIWKNGVLLGARTTAPTTMNLDHTGKKLSLYGIAASAASAQSIMNGIGMYGAKCTKNGVLYYNCIPVKSGSVKYSSTPAPSDCMWDTVNNTYRVAQVSSFTFVEQPVVTLPTPHNALINLAPVWKKPSVVVGFTANSYVGAYDYTDDKWLYAPKLYTPTLGASDTPGLNTIKGVSRPAITANQPFSVSLLDYLTGNTYLANFDRASVNQTTSLNTVFGYMVHPKVKINGKYWLYNGIQGVYSSEDLVNFTLEIPVQGNTSTYMYTNFAWNGNDIICCGPRTPTNNLFFYNTTTKSLVNNVLSDGHQGLWVPEENKFFRCTGTSTVSNVHWYQSDPITGITGSPTDITNSPGTAHYAEFLAYTKWDRKLYIGSYNIPGLPNNEISAVSVYDLVTGNRTYIPNTYSGFQSVKVQPISPNEVLGIALVSGSGTNYGFVCYRFKNGELVDSRFVQTPNNIVIGSINIIKNDYLVL